MEVYIDKNFVTNYWTIDSDDDIIDSFCNDFLKYSNRYTLITNYTSFDEIELSDEASLFFDELILRQNPAEIVYVDNLLEEDCLTSCLTSGNLKILFLECANERATHLETTFGYQVINTENLKNKWSKFIHFNDIEKTMVLEVDSSDVEVFNGWEDLKFISEFPNNSIVIVDRYILSDKSNGRIKENLIPMLEQIIPATFGGELHVSILSESILPNVGAAEVEKAKQIHGQLNSHFARYKSLKIKFTILKIDKAFYSKNQPNIHDRHIYTNYFTIKSGIGFDLFSNGKRKLEDSELSIRFNYHPRQMKTLPAKLEGLKTYINNMKKTEKLNAFKIFPIDFRKFNCALLN